MIVPVQITIDGQSVTVAGPAIIKASDPAAHATGERLAELLAPEDTIKAQMAGVFQSIATNLRTDPAYLDLEKKHPGVIDAVAFAMSAELRRAALNRLPDLRHHLGAIYDGVLSETELSQALDFYRSPAGKWLIEQMQNQAKGSVAQLNRERLADPARDVTSADLETSADAAKTKLQATMTPEQREAISAFIYSPLGEKLRALKPSLRQAQADWANERSPALAARLQSVTTETIRRFSHSSANQKGLSE
jgi:hypothetical protein